MSRFKQETDDLNTISLRQVGAWLGIQLPSRGSLNCPFHDHDDRNPSFQIKPDGRRWICYGCHRSGGPIDFVKFWEDIEFLEAKRRLRQLAGRTRIRPLHSTPKRRLNGVPPPAKEATADDQAIYEDLLQQCPLQEAGKLYLEERGISEPTYRKFKVGQLGPADVIIEQLTGKYGFDRLKSSGLLSTHSTLQNAKFLFPNNSLLFPFFEDQTITYIQARAIGQSTGKQKWRNLAGILKPIYNADALKELSHQTIAICEGVIDTLSAHEMKLNAIGFMGVSSRLTKTQINALQGKAVTILLDWDPVGEKRAAELQQEFRSHGIPSVRKRKPSETAKDLNDFLVEKRVQK